MTTQLKVLRNYVRIDRMGEVEVGYLSRDTVEKFVKAAVNRYGRDVPGPPQVDDVTGDGGKYYVIPTELSSWSEGFSRIILIEYPAAAIAADETPYYLEDEDWRDNYWSDVSGTRTRHLFLPNHAPASTETMRISYSIPYTWSDSPEVVAIPPEHVHPIADLAAALCCQSLATRYSQIGDTTIEVDAAAHASKAAEFESRAEMYLKAYDEFFGFGEDEEENAAGHFVDLDPQPAVYRDYLFRGRFRR